MMRTLILSMRFFHRIDKLTPRTSIFLIHLSDKKGYINSEG